MEVQGSSYALPLSADDYLEGDHWQIAAVLKATELVSVAALEAVAGVLAPSPEEARLTSMLASEGEIDPGANRVVSVQH